MTAASILFECVSAVFFYLWHELYLRWDFNELGRYFDPETGAVYTNSASILCVPAFVFLMLGAAAFLYPRRRG